MKNVTTEDFLAYLVYLGLNKLAILETGNSFEATLVKGCKPSLVNFTMANINPDGTYNVRLSKGDLFNDLITDGFFSATL
jgi:hypothetical protein